MLAAIKMAVCVKLRAAARLQDHHSGSQEGEAYLKVLESDETSAIFIERERDKNTHPNDTRYSSPLALRTAICLSVISFKCIGLKKKTIIKSYLIVAP